MPIGKDPATGKDFVFMGIEKFNKPRLIGYCFLYPVYSYDYEQYLEINGIRIYIDVHEDPVEHCKKYLAGFISINEV